MQQHHAIFLDAEEHAGDPALRQTASDFPDILGAHEVLLLRPACGEDAEAAAAVDAVGFEVGAVHGEHRGKGLAFGEIDESRVGKIHGPVPIARHQRVDGGQLAVRYDREFQGTRADELPGAFPLVALVSDQVEQLG